MERVKFQVTGLSDKLHASATNVTADGRVDRLGRPVIGLANGEPYFPSPRTASVAAAEALLTGNTHYTPTAGIPELRDAIARDFAADQGISIRGENVIVTPSAKFGLYLAYLSVLEPGDEIIVPDPGWVSFTPMAEVIGAKAVPWKHRQEDGFRPDLDELEKLITPRTRAVLMNSPSNPTGIIYSKAEVERVLDIVARHRIALISDEVYEGIYYDGHELVRPTSLPNGAEHTITVGGFSKKFAMTGWRLGYLIAPTEIVRVIESIQDHTVTCATSFGQVGALAVLEDDSSVQQMVKTYDENRRLMVSALRQLPGVSCADPEGGIFIFPEFSDDLTAGQKAQDWLLHNCGILGVDGAAFGEGLERYLRFSIASDPVVVAEAADRIRQYAKENYTQKTG